MIYKNGRAFHVGWAGVILHVDESLMVTVPRNLSTDTYQWEGGSLTDILLGKM